jgi:hypothetical protein
MRKIITQHNNLLSRAALDIPAEPNGRDIIAGRGSFPGLNVPAIPGVVIIQSSAHV